ncbi:DUF6232 family protein [Streptomyces sp. NPDC098789]|uniref:DUF6232 family protein n=1 Tax=Streptomyces sp. NPDC098789 TaxID=3366098 RepID=UPI003816DFED
MDSTGNVGAPPPPPTPPPTPPAPTASSPVRDTPPTTHRGRLVLRVSGRMLWVGSTAVPLHNIALVDAFTYRPSRWASFIDSLKWFVGIAVVIVVLAYASGGEVVDDDNSGALLPLSVVVLAVLAVAALLKMSKPVLAVETAGGTKILVTLPTVDELRHIAAQIVYAIDHPGAEFTTVVNYLAPVVNMHGGSGNTGIRA